ncbi:MAG: helix-turn-helix domain-containing protein [Candidatus Omnitrophica bacterium]|nr:helix-turn-helix domain-containing protein [Candidatus Omnitrophota bacterium]
MHTPTSSHNFLTTSQAAELLHVTRFTVLSWVKQGKLKAVTTLGGHQRIPREAVLDLLKKIKSNNHTEANLHDKEPVHEAIHLKTATKSRAHILRRSRTNIAETLKKGLYVSGKYAALIRDKFFPNKQINKQTGKLENFSHESN